MNEIVKNGAGQLPASVLAMQGLANSVAELGAAPGTGEQYMKMTRSGDFVFGVDEIEVEENSHWAINPTAFLHGWICWGTEAQGTSGQMLGEIMAPATGPLPAQTSLPDKPGDWKKQVAISLRCMDGEDEGVQCVFNTNSIGGLKAYGALVGAVVARVNEGEAACVPVVTLSSSFYNHKNKTYGKIYTPEFKIQKWITLDGLGEADEEVAEEAPAKAKAEPEEKAPARRRRRRD